MLGYVAKVLEDYSTRECLDSRKTVIVDRERIQWASWEFYTEWDNADSHRWEMG